MSSADNIHASGDMNANVNASPDALQRDRRRDLVAQAARERLQGVATQSRGVASTTRTRVSPYVGTAQERLQRSREQLRRRQQEQDLAMEIELEMAQQQRSLPVVPLVLAAIVVVIAVIAFLRSRGSEDGQDDEMDVLLSAGMSLSEMGEPGLTYVDDDLIVAIEER